MDRREIEQLFAFDRWANHQALDAIRTVPEPPSTLYALLGHTLSALDNWCSSIERTDPLDWDEPDDPEHIAAYLEEIEARTKSLVETLSQARLSEVFDLRDPSRARFPIVVGDVLKHVALHGVEHRAQIMLEVGKLGGRPVELQYASFVSERPDRD